jgi:hypothetical protein
MNRNAVQHPEVSCNQCPRHITGFDQWTEKPLIGCCGPRQWNYVEGRYDYPYQIADKIKFASRPFIIDDKHWECDPALAELEWRDPKRLDTFMSRIRNLFKKKD